MLVLRKLGKRGFSRERTGYSRYRWRRNAVFRELFRERRNERNSR